MKFRLSYFFVLFLALWACQDTDDYLDVDTVEVVSIPVVDTSGDENYLNGNSEYIFDQNKVHTFQLNIPESALEILDQDPAAEEYVEGTLIFEGDTISPVGIRYKGSIGAFVGCLSGTNIFDPSGFKTCTKLSMKVKINWDGRDEKFYGLKKLQFHSMNNDPSQMRERLGYYLFGAMGVPTPRAVHARLVINNTYVGLFALVEQIDNRFVKENFDDDEGNLYKEIWPLNMEGIPFSEQQYRDALKTNENDNASVDLIRSFGEDIANSSVGDARTIVEQKMELENIMSYAVVDRTIRHDDGPFHWYCFDGDCSNHNYFWYEEPNAEKLHLIPWDLDNAFENIIDASNPVTSVADEWGETSNNCAPFSNGFLGIGQWSAACDKLTMVWTTYEVKYAQAKQNFLNGPFSESNVNQLLNSWQDQIREATLEASEAHSDAINTSQWENAINELRSQLEFARNK